MKTGISKYLANDEKIQKYLNLNLKMLSFIGLNFNLNEDKSISRSKFFQRLPIFMTNALGIFVVFVQIFYIRHALPRDTHLTTQIMSELFSNILCISKGFRLATSCDQIQILLYEISFIWDKYRPTGNRCDDLLNKAQKTLSFCKCYLGVAICGIIAFGLPPLQVFLLMYPFEVSTTASYLSVLFEEEYLLLVSGIYWVGCDTLFAQLTTHTSIQFEILQNDLETLINHENVEDHLKQNIAIFIKRHQGLLRICDLIEDVFSPVILTTMLLSATNICVNVFELRTMFSKGYDSDTAPYATLVMILLFQIVFYCTYAETLTEQTNMIANSIYNCKWRKNYKLRFFFQMIIMKSQTPFYCTAYGFFAIGHKQFLSILSTSYSYYMMLQSTS